MVDLRIFCFLWFISILFVMSHIYTCLTQLNSIFFVIVVFIVDGIAILSSIRKKWINYTLKSALFVLYTAFFISFFSYYYLGQYTAETYPIRLFFNLQSEAISFIEEHPEYGVKGVQTAIPASVYGISCRKSPYELGISLDSPFIENEYVHCGYLGPIEDGYFYIVDDTFSEYSIELRENGFSENKYIHYSLFYKEP